MQIEMVPLSDLRPYSGNPRINDDAVEGVAKSIQEFGFRQPIVVDGEGTIVCGHTRFKAAQQLGLDRVPVHVAKDLTEEQLRAYRLADNRSAEKSKWDYDLLPLELEGLKASNYDLSLIGFTLEDLTQIYGPDEPGEGLSDPDEIPEPSQETITCKGDLWELGEHRLLCGDSTRIEDVTRLMGGVTGAMLLATDPPYGVNFAGAKYNPKAKQWAAIDNDDIKGEDLKEFLVRVLQAWLPLLSKQAGFYFWTAAMEEGAAAAAAIREAGLHIQSQIVWIKNTLVLGQADYHWRHENCWYAFWKGEKHRWLGERDKTTVWEVKKVANSNYLHPMQKPVELYTIPMQHHTLEGEIVVEPFCGSGSQIIAAEQLNRKCFAMEISPEYCDVAVKRWETFTGRKAERISPGEVSV